MAKIKCCEENLVIALRACAKAHNANFCDYRDEGQVGIDKDNVPTQSDMRSILNAFVKEEFADIDTSFGYTIAYLYDETAYRKEVNEFMLKLALPYNCKPRWVK